MGDRVKILRKPGKYGEFKTGFQSWSVTTHEVTRIERRDGSPLFTVIGYERPLALHEILKVEGVEKPPAQRARTKQKPSLTLEVRRPRTHPLVQIG